MFIRATALVRAWVRSKRVGEVYQAENRGFSMRCESCGASSWKGASWRLMKCDYCGSMQMEEPKQYAKPFEVYGYRALRMREEALLRSAADAQDWQRWRLEAQQRAAYSNLTGSVCFATGVLGSFLG